MDRGKGAALGILALIGLFLYTRANAVTVYDDGTSEAGDLLQINPTAAAEADSPDDPGDDLDMSPAPDSGADPVSAFLYMLEACENTAADVASGLAYQRFYGGATFYDMSDHPVLTGELKGVPLPPQTCINAGLEPPCVSTGAGAFQITVPTWRDFRQPGDAFDIQGQRNAATAILQKLGVIDRLNAGDLQGAIHLAGGRWASLPGAVAKQGQRSLAFAVNAYNTAPTA